MAADGRHTSNKGAVVHRSCLWCDVVVVHDRHGLLGSSSWEERLGQALKEHDAREDEDDERDEAGNGAGDSPTLEQARGEERRQPAGAVRGLVGGLDVDSLEAAHAGDD